MTADSLRERADESELVAAEVVAATEGIVAEVEAEAGEETA